jgi:hypothetical protein
MRVVTAASKEQEEEIHYLLCQLYEDILPFYYKEHELQSFKNMHLLQFNSFHQDYLGTMDEALQMIGALQVINAILEQHRNGNTEIRHEDIFYKNCKKLANFGINCPIELNCTNSYTLSTWSLPISKAKIANQLLV